MQWLLNFESQMFYDLGCAMVKGFWVLNVFFLAHLFIYILVFLNTHRPFWRFCVRWSFFTLAYISLDSWISFNVSPILANVFFWLKMFHALYMNLDTN